MKILLTGAAGQLGSALFPMLSQLGDVLAVDQQSSSPDVPVQHMDVSDAGSLETCLNRNDPDLVVNAAAYTSVDRAESEPERAFAVNATAPGRMARWAQRNGKALLHYSTDYVFDGASGEPYVESDPATPLNTYGESKLAGERAISASGCRHIILRSSWVYSAHGNNFVLSMLQLARGRHALNVVDDQVGCPTWAGNLAAASTEVIRQALTGASAKTRGIYHYCDRDMLSWYDFAQRVFTMAHEFGLIRNLPELHRVGSDAYPQVAHRPVWSVLECSALEKRFGIKPVPLDASLKKCLEEMLAHD